MVLYGGKNMKRMLALILTLMLMLALIPASAEDGKVTATGVGQGIDGDVVVEVTADAGTIYEVKILEQNETPGIGSVAVEKLPGMIVEANSINVDSIASATVTAWPSRTRCARR